MNNRTLALIIQEGTRMISTFLRNRELFIKPVVAEEVQPSNELEETPNIPDTLSEKATSVATGCVPCAIGHLGTCSGLLNEAMRFGRNDGIESEEVINRVNICLDELNTMERVDLRSELVYKLPDWEKRLALAALDLSRSVRHGLEGISSIADLESIAAKTQGSRQEIGATWFKERLQRMTPDQREMVKEKLQEKFSLDQAKKVAAEAAAKQVEQRWNSQEKK